MKGIILAGGKGTRLRPLTHTGAKQAIPVANKPIICYVIEDLVAAGIREIGIIVGYTSERIQSLKDTIGDEKKYGAKITYIEQDAPKGIAHAVYCAKDFIGGEPFVVYLGDNMLENGIKSFVQEFSCSKADASILLTPVENPSMYGVAYLDGKGNISKVEEKPANPSSNKAIIGVYLFTKAIFQVIPNLKPSKRGELEITDAIEGLLKQGSRVIPHVVEGWWDDTGTPEAILSVNKKVLEGKMKAEMKGTVEKGAVLSGKVGIGEGTEIDADTKITGPAIIGKNCRIKNSHIGPNVSIGDDCILQNAKISSSLILEGAKITYNAAISDSIIGKNTQILSDGKKAARIIIGENSTIIL